MLFMRNLRFVGVNLLKLCFSYVSEMFVRSLAEMRWKVSENALRVMYFRGVVVASPVFSPHNVES